MMFARKIGGSLATALSGVVLSVVGFVPNVDQSATSLLGIRILFAGLPFAGFVVGALLFRRFPLGMRPAPAVVTTPVTVLEPGPGS